MARIDKDTGLLLPENSDQALLQSVRDRLMTRIGSRPQRSEYGSLVGRANPNSNELSDSIRDSLSSDQLINSIQISLLQDRLSVLVNYKLRITV